MAYTSNIPVRNSDWSNTGYYFNVTADASVSGNTVAVTIKTSYSRSGYYVQSSGLLALVKINGEIVSHPTRYYSGLESSLSGYTNVLGNGTTSGYDSHFSPTPPYDGGTYAKFWGGVEYTVKFTKTIPQTTSAQSISWSINFIPSEDGANKATLSNETWKATGTVTIPALPSYKITLDPNGGYFSGDSAAKEITVIVGSTQNCRLADDCLPERDGYTFTGYFDEAGMRVYWANGVCEDKDEFTYWSSSNTWQHAGNVTLYAGWTPNTYRLTFNANGGTNTSGGNFALTTPATGYGATESWVTVTYDSSNFSAMSGNNPTRTGYKFLGWYTAASVGTQIYDANGGSTNNGTYWSTSGTWNTTDSKTVYAQWEALATMFIKVGNTHESGIPYVKAGNTWKKCIEVDVKVVNEWKRSIRP